MVSIRFTTGPFEDNVGCMEKKTGTTCIISDLGFMLAKGPCHELETGYVGVV